MVKVSVNRYVSRRIEKLRIEVETDTKRIREKALRALMFTRKMLKPSETSN